RETEKLAKELRANAAGSYPGGTSASAAAANGKRRESVAAEDRSALADPNEADIADKLQMALGTKVMLRGNAGGAGKIEIEFYSAQELDRLVELLIHGRY